MTRDEIAVGDVEIVFAGLVRFAAADDEDVDVRFDVDVDVVVVA